MTNDYIFDPYIWLYMHYKYIFYCKHNCVCSDTVAGLKEEETDEEQEKLEKNSLARNAL